MKTKLLLPFRWLLLALIANPAATQSAQAQINAAIAGTANNIPGVAALGIAISDPPQQGEVQAVADKVDQLINTLTR